MRRAGVYRGLQQAGIIAALLALALRLLVPAGFMWVPDAYDGLALTLCSGTAPVPASAPMAGKHHMAATDDKHHPSSGDNAGDHACAFAALGGWLDLTTDIAVTLALPPLIATAPSLLVAASAPGRGLAAPPPPSRGPPVPF